MAVENYLSNELTEGFRGDPRHDHGKMRVQYFAVPALTVAGDIGSTFEMFKLPPGNVRVLPRLCRIRNSAWGASRTFNIGHRAYMSRPPGNTMVAEDDDAFALGLDFSSATDNSLLLGIKFDLYSLQGVTVFGTVAGGTAPIGATVDGYFAYIYE